ncbi:Pentulose kinase, putative [Babesia ovata]|uniref:Pentulose kinase, putative n=1 Tax=Babesia ovata TaxID=189622 RepID=A0A2H6KIL2_9APIC|nr:Pentulose kinase, putative [Babesia ovata]GBE62832.1 Pentulose kinase, putative [Babesia ovata]
MDFPKTTESLTFDILTIPCTLSKTMLFQIFQAVDDTIIWTAFLFLQLLSKLLQFRLNFLDGLADCSGFVLDVVKCKLPRGVRLWDHFGKLSGEEEGRTDAIEELGNGLVRQLVERVHLLDGDSEGQAEIRAGALGLVAAGGSGEGVDVPEREAVLEECWRGGVAVHDGGA